MSRTTTERILKYTTFLSKNQIKISYQTKGAAWKPPNQFGGFQAEELDESD